MKALAQSVARKIISEGDSLYTRDGHSRGRNDRMRNTLGKARIPRKPYQVTYVIDKNGPYKVDRQMEFVRPFGVRPGDGIGFAVCFLPAHFLGCRVRREVRLS